MRAAPALPCWASSSVFLVMVSNCARIFWARSSAASWAVLTFCKALRSLICCTVWNESHATTAIVRRAHRHPRVGTHLLRQAARLVGAHRPLLDSGAGLAAGVPLARRHVDADALLGEDALERFVVVAHGEIGDGVHDFPVQGFELSRLLEILGAGGNLRLKRAISLEEDDVRHDEGDGDAREYRHPGVPRLRSVTERGLVAEVASSRILALSSARSLEIWPRPSESGSYTHQCEVESPAGWYWWVRSRPGLRFRPGGHSESFSARELTGQAARARPSGAFPVDNGARRLGGPVGAIRYPRQASRHRGGLPCSRAAARANSWQRPPLAPASHRHRGLAARDHAGGRRDRPAAGLDGARHLRRSGPAHLARLALEGSRRAREA